MNPKVFMVGLAVFGVLMLGAGFLVYMKALNPEALAVPLAGFVGWLFRSPREDSPAPAMAPVEDKAAPDAK